MARKSAFGAEPEQIRELLSFGLEDSNDQEAAPTASLGAVLERPGGQIGRYKLLSVLGEGGMGIVYLAEQERPIKRRVALKVIKPGMDSKAIIARFQVERQTLALLEHPNIAHVHDAGTTETGRPYFVMEYVKGVPITEHCDRQKSTIEERLRLFLKVCEAIQHAHLNGIIHRDIKPSNVQIAIQGQLSIPKVIDFGVAKAINRLLTERTLVTEQGQFVGTPEYMSPEQAEMTGQDVDTRSDIYSLGVLLYELLTGILPFDPKILRERGIDHIRRIIREEEPKTPSTRLSIITGEDSTKLAQLRRTDVRTLGRQLHGDLDWITLKAMEKDRTRRYQTAHAFAEDIQRHLNNEPVLAGPPSKIYRLKKFFQKHRTQSIGAAIAGILIAIIAVVSVMYIQAASKNKEAEALQHNNILAKAQEFRSMGNSEEALKQVDTILNSRYVGRNARLLHARLVLYLHGPANALKELKGLLKEEDELAGQAHYLMAQIYYESDPDAPGRTDDYRQKWEHHHTEAERLLPESADSYVLQAMTAGTVPTALTLLDKALKEDERHYDSLRERSCLSYASRNYYKMIVDAAKMTAIRPDSSLGYSLCAIAQRELGQFKEALENHTKAINRSINDPELYNQRWKTHMLMGNYDQALLDARKSTELQPENSAYHFNVFCVLTALGSYDKAKADFEKIVKSDIQIERHFRSVWSRKYVFETLKAGLTWYPGESKPPQSGLFLEMYDADEDYRQLAEKAELAVIDGFHPDWSPDGNELVYSQGIVGSSGIAILNLESGKTRLLTIPGKDPEWSPDGKYIAYVRDRQILPYGHLVADRGLTQESSLKEEVWLVKADGTENPRFLASGGWPQWSKDCKRIFYHSRVEKKLCSIAIEEDAKPVPIIQCIYFQPAVSHDEKYVAFRSGSRNLVVELSSKSIVASWTGPFLISVDASRLPPEQKWRFSDSVIGPFIYDREKDNISWVLASRSIQNCRLSPGETNQLAIVSRRWGRYPEIWIADAEVLDQTLLLEEHFRQMVGYFTRRIEGIPEDVENYYSRAKYHIYLKEREKAFKDLDKYAEITNDSAEMARRYRFLATDLLQINPDVAIELFRKAHNMQSENWAYLHGLGAAFYYAGQWEEAITNFTKSIKFSGGENASNYLFLAMSYWQLHEESNATNCYNKAIEWMENNRDKWIREFDGATFGLYIEAADLMGIKAKEF